LWDFKANSVYPNKLAQHEEVRREGKVPIGSGKPQSYESYVTRTASLRGQSKRS